MKTKEEAIREIVGDDDNIYSVIKNAPQTYNSILQHMKDCGTLQVILRRRIKRLCKEQKIWKMRVPGTRFGLVLFCTPEHDYKILISQKMIGVRIFYMYEFNDDGKNIILNNYWELKGDNWNKWEYCDNIVKIPKYTIRDGGFRLYD